MKVQGKIKPLGSKIFVCDMDFGEQITANGIIVPSDNAKGSGIHPRWAKVWAKGDLQTDVEIGQWILIEHGRWTRTIEYETEQGNIMELRMVDNDAILLVSDTKPTGAIQREVQGIFDLHV